MKTLINPWLNAAVSSMGLNARQVEIVKAPEPDQTDTLKLRAIEQRISLVEYTADGTITSSSPPCLSFSVMKEMSWLESSVSRCLSKGNSISPILRACGKGCCVESEAP